MDSTHANWINSCFERLIDCLNSNTQEVWKEYFNVAYQIAQARPSELREFICGHLVPPDERIIPLLVLSWRIVGNEFSDIRDKAVEEITMLCDMDEAENATEHLRS